MLDPMNIRPIEFHDLKWIRSLLTERWGSPEIVSCGHLHHADTLPGFVALEEETPVGLVTYHLRDDACEIVTLDALIPGKRIGAKLVDAIIRIARTKKCSRVWLVTTNDNDGAIRFYRKVGFKYVTTYVDAIVEARKLKPSIPETGYHNTPIRDEVEFEIRLG